LRRVHFVVVYGGDEFKDEGGLLFSAVSVEACVCVCVPMA